MLEEITISKEAASIASSILHDWLAKTNAGHALRQTVSKAAQAMGWADRIIIDDDAL